MNQSIELWGGHECTCARIGGAVYDQTIATGHQDRPEDLDRFASLGLAKLRYPVLWERVAPDAPELEDWSWSDARLQRLQQLGVGVIAGLVHHGAGPAYAGMDTDAFAPGLARYARAAAERYPWITDWTPVNEPLTTARFGCLYGHWSPHARDEALLWRTLLNQIDGVRLAMAEIRQVIPGARLIQTEDLGRAQASEPLISQARFENVRRWLTFDLLFGRVVPGHPLYARLYAAGLADRLAAIADAPCPPEVIGINHYVTSDRYLDNDLWRWPAHTHGGNGDQAYADVEAVRVPEARYLGLENALREAWLRYGGTGSRLAVTELHLGCTREEQLRWLREGWTTAHRLRQQDGVDVEAVTVWSLLGAYDWDSLLTQRRGHYEPGCFDVRATPPRPTALAAEVRAIAQGQAPLAVAEAKGWWRGPAVARRSQSPILIVGRTGTLGQALVRACASRGLHAVAVGREAFRLEDARSMSETLDGVRPFAVINAAGYVRVDDAEREEALCRSANALGAAALARLCAERGLRHALFSSDLVFDGQSGAPYLEHAAPQPLNAYGRSKAEAERLITAAGVDSLIIRTAAFFQAEDTYNFAVQTLGALERGDQHIRCADCVVSPTYVPDLVSATLDLVMDGETGIWHLANAGAESWASFAQQLAVRHGFDPGRIEAVASAQMGWAAPRPAFAALATGRGQLLPTLENAIDRFAAAFAQYRALSATRLKNTNA